MAAGGVTPLKVSDEAFAGLVHQRGALWGLRDDRAAWEAAYAKALARVYHAMAPVLPDIEGPTILDIGAGMGGIDLLLWRHYGASPNTDLVLLDGRGRSLECADHDAPFGDLNLTEAFLAANGVDRSQIIALEPDERRFLFGEGHFDLVISIRAWGFHVEPAAYLDWALKAAKPGAAFVLDIRRARVAWLAEFIAALGKPTFLARDAKSDLVAFRA